MARLRYSYARNRRPPTHHVRFTHRSSCGVVADRDDEYGTTIALAPPEASRGDAP